MLQSYQTILLPSTTSPPWHIVILAVHFPITSCRDCSEMYEETCKQVVCNPSHDYYCVLMFGI